MVSYFYNADYDASKHTNNMKIPEALVHARVIIIAEKYACTSLYELAKTRFTEALKEISCDNWAMIATLIYEYTTMDAKEHVKLRRIVVQAAVITRRFRPTVLKSALRKEKVVELLRDNADLATDLLLIGRDGPDGTASESPICLFMCDFCHYVHFGLRSCDFASQIKIPCPEGDEETDEGPYEDTSTPSASCPYCSSISGKETNNFWHRVGYLTTFPCIGCDGVYTAEPDYLLESEVE
ncbi:unnamed protein product [Periconia digitata]|uniref:Uncharacterized protein n=1 Tax=Periconia digitata TaxID=1303443 RepID=A0A9W4UBX0_9PLEO|nr:unnamed protein product [Periconia digitata]